MTVVTGSAAVIESCAMEPVRTILYDPPEIEYLDGHPHPKVSPKTAHSFVQAALGRIIEDCAGDRGAPGTEWRFDPGAIDTTVTEFVPDVAYVSWERFRALSPDRREKLPFSPEIAVEVRSPTDDLKYLTEKIARYLNTGSLLVLDVDPATRTIVAHSAQGVREYASDAYFEHKAIPWLRFPVAAAFAKLDEYRK